MDPSLPRTLDRIISTCIALKPEDRYQDVRDLLRDLRWCEKDLSETASPSIPPRRSTSWLVHGSWAAALLLAVAAALWFSPRALRNDRPPPNPLPVIVLMDRRGRVTIRTAVEGGTNADDLTAVLQDLPVAIRKENTSAMWRREEQVVAENPDLIVSHLSCLLDARLGGDQAAVSQHLFDVAENRLLIVLAYVAARNPRTHSIVYSRGRFQEAGGEHAWVTIQEGRLPVLRNRLHAFIVPGGSDATFRVPATGQLIRTRVTEIVGVPNR